MIVIKGTQELLTQYYGKPQKDTVRSVVVVDEGRPLAVAGLRVDTARMVAFADISDELRNHKSFKRIVVKAYREWLTMFPETTPVYAVADTEIEGATNLLIHAGFEHFKGDTWRI